MQKIKAYLNVSTSLKQSNSVWLPWRGWNIEGSRPVKRHR
jgi:hypothetical protein